MILWGLLLSVAHAEPAAPAPAGVDVSAAAPATPGPTLEERLLGEPGVDEPPAVEPLPVLDTFAWWPILLVAAGAGAVWWTRRRLEQKQAEDTGSELRVVGRADLGAQSGLAVVEVRDRNGTWRRLVIGTGDGTPALVADLGEPQFGLLGEDEDSTVEEVAPYRTPPSPDRSLSGDLPRDFDRYDPLPSPSEAGLPPLPADPKSGRALVHEVLGERRRKGRPARRSASFHTFA
ncbi:MAG: flagellar biosynthetic protein FliO [Myxococcota bacterium]